MRMELKKVYLGVISSTETTATQHWQNGNESPQFFTCRTTTLCLKQAEPILRFLSLNLVLNLVVRLVQSHPLWKRPWPLLQFSAKKCVFSLSLGLPNRWDILVSFLCRECRTKSAEGLKEKAHYWHLWLQPWLRLTLTLEFCFLRKIPFWVKPIWTSCRSIATQSSGRGEK